MVRSGLVTAWRLAGWPTRGSPSSVNATIEGVVRMPSAFSMTFGVLPSITATHEFVVPRSIPMTFPMCLISFFLRQVGWALRAHQTKPPDIKYSRDCDGEPHIGGGVGAARTGRNDDPRKRLPLEDSIPCQPAAAPGQLRRAIGARAVARNARKNRSTKRNRGLI